MSFTIISPLGPRIGPGTFDTIWNDKKYLTRQQAEAENDVVVIDFVKDEDATIYLQGYHTRNPEDKMNYELVIQHFPLGIDVRDDKAAMAMASYLMANNP